MTLQVERIDNKRLSTFQKVILAEAEKQPQGLFTIFRLRQSLARKVGLSTDTIRPDSFVANLSPAFSFLVASGAVGVMTGIERLGTLSREELTLQFPQERFIFNFINTQGKLTDKQFHQFKPKPKNARYPIVYRLTSKGRRVLAQTPN